MVSITSTIASGAYMLGKAAVTSYASSSKQTSSHQGTYLGANTASKDNDSQLELTQDILNLLKGTNSNKAKETTVETPAVQPAVQPAEKPAEATKSLPGSKKTQIAFGSLANGLYRGLTASITAAGKVATAAAKVATSAVNVAAATVNTLSAPVEGSGNAGAIADAGAASSATGCEGSGNAGAIA